MTVTTAVVALDGSQLSESSLGYLPMLKPLGDLRVHLVAVAEVFAEGVDLAGMEDLAQREHQLVEGYLSGLGAKLHDQLDVHVEIEVRDGHPDHEIVDAAEKAGASLLVLTTHGRSGLGRWSIGSVADKVIRSARCDLLVIGPEAAGRRPPPSIQNILAPLDGSGQAEAALQVAHEWARACGATLHLVRCFQPPAMAFEAPAMPDMIGLVRDSAQAYLEKVRQWIDDVPVRLGVFLGAPADQLKAYSEQYHIDMVVMSPHGRRGLARSILGSVTDRMLHGPAPMLIVHPK